MSICIYLFSPFFKKNTCVMSIAYNFLKIYPIQQISQVFLLPKRCVMKSLIFLIKVYPKWDNYVIFYEGIVILPLLITDLFFLSLQFYLQGTITTSSVTILLKSYSFHIITEGKGRIENIQFQPQLHYCSLQNGLELVILENIQSKSYINYDGNGPVFPFVRFLSQSLSQ